MKANKHKISVGVITYNQENTIRQTLDSILMQKGDFDLELVIGEDCSTDSTRAICEEYTAHHTPYTIVLLPSQKNLGIMANFARVMKACKGDFIGILSGDDYWCDDHKLEKQLKFMISNPQFGVCCTSGYRLMVESGRMLDGIEPIKPIESGDISKFYENHFSGIYAQPLSLLIRQELFKFVDFDEFIRRKFLIEDMPMQSVLAHHTLFGYIPDKTCVYRIYTNSTTFTSYESTKYMAFHKSIVDIRRYLHSLYPNDVPFSEEDASEYIQYKEFLKYVWNGQYERARIIAYDTNIRSRNIKKMRMITWNIIIFYCFMIYKHYKRYKEYKKRAN